MNRQSLLNLIQQHVRDSIADDGSVRPLGEVVANVLRDLETAPTKTSQSITTVVPVELVAAFVDGELNETETDAVCAAAISDRSVVAEIVAAVRTIEQDAIQGEFSSNRMPDDLTRRLIQMGSSLQSGNGIEQSSDEPSPEQTPPVIRVAESTSSAHRRTYRSKLLTAAIAAIAAAGLGVVYLNRPESKKDNRQPNQDLIVEDAPDARAPTTPDDVAPPDDIPDTIPGSEKVVESSNDNPTRNAPEEDKKIALDQSPKPSTAPMDAPPEADRIVPPIESRPASFSGLTWSQVSGILAEEFAAPEASGSRSQTRWQSVSENSESFANLSEVTSVALRTLSLSRAKGELESGGSVVIPGDSSAVFSSAENVSVSVDLRHGAIAMTDLPANTVVELNSRAIHFGRLKWEQPKSKLIAEHTAAGLTIHVQGTGVTLEGIPIGDSTVVVKNGKPEKVPTLKRLPNWVNRPVDSVALPRNVLAQIRQTDDLLPELTKRVTALSRKPNLNAPEAKAFAVLAQWQVGLLESNLFRLIGNRNPALRLVALQTMVNMPDWDPRYNLVWRSLATATPDRTKTARIKSLCKMVRDGQMPTDQQVNQMVANLNANGAATRVMYDYLLRRFAGGGPPVDPMGNTASQRAQLTSGWNRYLRRN